MASKTEAILRNAVKQIKAGKGSKARKSLVELLRAEPENAQAWYLLSFTLEDPQRQQYALLRALKVYPNFERARNRLKKLRGEDASAETAPSFTLPIAPPAVSSQESITPAFFAQSEPQKEQSPTEIEPVSKSENATPKRRSNLVAIILAIIVIALLIFIAWVFLPGITAVPPTVTPIASRTLPATWTLTPIPPSATETSTPTATSSPIPEITLSATGEGSAVR